MESIGNIKKQKTNSKGFGSKGAQDDQNLV
jgi:hypothetical protein